MALFAANKLWAQKRLGCTQTLQLAQSIYKQGQLYKIPSILEECLKNKNRKTGFTKQEKIEALKLLILSYLYEEEPEKADGAMLKFLYTNPQFTINESVDPEEFITLYKTFRTWSLFSVGAKLGVSLLFPHIQKVSYIAATEVDEKNGGYTPSIGLQIGAAFEVPIRKKSGGTLKWVLAPEMYYSSSTVMYQNSSMTKNELSNLPNANIETKINQQHLLLNLMMHYKIIKSRFNPYLGIGPSISYLLSSSAQIETQFQQTNNVVTGPPIDLSSNFNTIGLDAVVSLGAAFQIGAAMLTSEVQYRYGITNQINSNKPINTPAALDYGYQINAFNVSNVIINLGFSLPIFIPKKHNFIKASSKKR